MAKDKKPDNINNSSSQDEQNAESIKTESQQMSEQNGVAPDPVAEQKAETAELQPVSQDKELSKEGDQSKEIKSSTDEALAKLKAEIDSEKASYTDSKGTSSQKTRSKESSSDSGSDYKDNVSIVKVKRSGFAVFAFLISLGAAGAVGFLWWQSQLWLENQAQVEQLKQQSLVNSQQAINQLQSRITELQNAQTNQVTNNDVIRQSLNSYAARINELGQSQPNFWLAAESKYLINLAERRLLVEQDVDTAIQLLLDANQRLTAMQDPSVFHIRTAISEDVASLYSLKTPETDDVYLTLSGLVSEAQQIKFAQAYIPKPAEQAELAEQVSDNVNDWQQNLMTSLKRFFGHFIKITKRDAQVQPQLPADQQWYVRSNLTTQLLMAQAATLDKHTKRYQDAIAKLQLWTQQYFDLSDARVAAFVTSLQSLSQQNVALELPSGLASQALISNYVVEQMSLKQTETSDDKAVNND